MNKKAAYALRIILGGYLAYLGVRILILMVREKPTDMIFMCVMSAVFIVVGGGYAVYCLKKLFDIRKGEKGTALSDESENDNESSVSRNPNAVRRMNMQATEIKKVPGENNAGYSDDENDTFSQEKKEESDKNDGSETENRSGAVILSEEKETDSQGYDREKSDDEKIDEEKSDEEKSDKEKSVEEKFIDEKNGYEKTDEKRIDEEKADDQESADGESSGQESADEEIENDYEEK